MQRLRRHIKSWTCRRDFSSRGHRGRRLRQRSSKQVTRRQIDGFAQEGRAPRPTALALRRDRDQRGILFSGALNAVSLAVEAPLSQTGMCHEANIRRHIRRQLFTLKSSIVREGSGVRSNRCCTSQRFSSRRLIRN